MVLPQVARKNAPISRTDKRFSKNLTFVCSYVLDDEIAEEKCTLISKTAMFQQFCQKNDRNHAKMAPFLDEGAFLLGELIVQRRTTKGSRPSTFHIPGGIPRRARCARQLSHRAGWDAPGDFPVAVEATCGIPVAPDAPGGVPVRKGATTGVPWHEMRLMAPLLHEMRPVVSPGAIEIASQNHSVTRRRNTRKTKLLRQLADALRGRLGASRRPADTHEGGEGGGRGALDCGWEEHSHPLEGPITDPHVWRTLVQALPHGPKRLTLTANCT